MVDFSPGHNWQFHFYSNLIDSTNFIRSPVSSACPQSKRTQHTDTHTSPSYDDSSSYQHCTVNRFCRLKITTTTTKMQREKQNDVINFMGKHTSSVIYSNPLQFNPIRRELRACVFAALVCSVCVHKQCHTIGIFLHTDDGLFPPILICF